MKKVLSLALVLVMVLGMVTMASAATYGQFKATSGANVVFKQAGTGTAVSEVYTGDVSVQNGTKHWPVTIDLTALTFVAGTNDPVATASILTEGRKGNVTIKTSVKKGAKAVDKVDWYDVSGTGKSAIKGIELVLKDDLQDISDGVEFDVRSYLVVDGKHYSNDIVQWTGKLANDKSDKEIDSDYDYVFFGNGEIIIPKEYIKSIEMDLGEGVSVFGKLFKEKKYWAKASMDSYNDAEDEFMSDNDIDTVYHLREINVKNITDHVNLNEDSSLFVYARNGDETPVYVGKGNAKLDFYETYYLSAKELDFDTDEPVDEDGSDVPELSGETGGDDFYPANVNDNPGTGC